MTKNSLVHLALEVRLQVYKQFFDAIHVALHRQKSLDANEFRDRACVRVSRPPQFLALLLSCKTIKNEAYPIFLSHTHFSMYECPCWEKNHCPPPQILNRMGQFTYELPNYGFRLAELQKVIANRDITQNRRLVNLQIEGAGLKNQFMLNFGKLLQVCKGRVDRIAAPAFFFNPANVWEHIECDIVIDAHQDITRFGRSEDGLALVKNRFVKVAKLPEKTNFTFVKTSSAAEDEDAWSTEDEDDDAEDLLATEEADYYDLISEEDRADTTDEAVLFDDDEDIGDSDSDDDDDDGVS